MWRSEPKCHDRGQEERIIATRPRARNGVVERAKAWFWPIVGILVGVLVGLAVFTFGYANGSAYFGKDPQTCSQCHSMNKQYAAWS